jgi:hypothetical protein
MRPRSAPVRGFARAAHCDGRRGGPIARRHTRCGRAPLRGRAPYAASTRARRGDRPGARARGPATARATCSGVVRSYAPQSTARLGCRAHCVTRRHHRRSTLGREFIRRSIRVVRRGRHGRHGSPRPRPTPPRAGTPKVRARRRRGVPPLSVGRRRRPCRPFVAYQQLRLGERVGHRRPPRGIVARRSPRDGVAELGREGPDERGEGQHGRGGQRACLQGDRRTQARFSGRDTRSVSVQRPTAASANGRSQLARPRTIGARGSCRTLPAGPPRPRPPPRTAPRAAAGRPRPAPARSGARATRAARGEAGRRGSTPSDASRAERKSAAASGALIGSTVEASRHRA